MDALSIVRASENKQLIEFTLTKDDDPAKYEEIFNLFAEFFADVAVKPAAGTLRVVDALAMPGMLVEYEFWAAK